MCWIGPSSCSCQASGSVEAAATLGLPMIVISNQAAVGKGLLDLDGLEEITAQMHQALTR